MQLCSTSSGTRHEMNAISLIRKENAAEKSHQNVRKIHLHIPTTTSISAVAHMTIILAIPISQTSAIP
nr:13816_t:CDS:2 [Entrophospora candida]